MNKRRMVKRTLAGAGICFALGLVLYTAGTVMGGRRESLEALGASGYVHVRDESVWLGRDTGGIYVDRSGVHIYRDRFPDQTNAEGDIAWQEDIRNIEADLDWGSILVREGERAGVTVERESGVSGGEEELFHEIKDGTLKIWTEDLGLGGDERLVITLPAGVELDQVELKTEMGDVSWEVPATARMAELESELGDVSCTGLSAGELKASSNLGDVTVHLPGGAEPGYELKAKLGEIHVNGTGLGSSAQRNTSQSSCFVEAESELGDVTLEY